MASSVQLRIESLSTKAYRNGSLSNEVYRNDCGLNTATHRVIENYRTTQPTYVNSSSL